MNSSIKNLLIVVGIVVLLVIGLIVYSEFFMPSSQTELSSSQPLNSQNPGQNIEVELDLIKNLNLSAGTALFADPGYQSLHDSTIVLTEEPSGRPNPFLPVVGGVSQPIANSTSTKKSK